MIYKLTLDFSSINLNVLVEEFAKYNIEVCFGDENLYLFSKHATIPLFLWIWKEENIKIISSKN